MHQYDVVVFVGRSFTGAWIETQLGHEVSTKRGSLLHGSVD